LSAREYYEKLNRLKTKQLIIIDLLALHFTEQELVDLIDNLVAEAELEQEELG